MGKDKGTDKGRGRGRGWGKEKGRDKGGGKGRGWGKEKGRDRGRDKGEGKGMGLGMAPYSGQTCVQNLKNIKLLNHKDIVDLFQKFHDSFKTRVRTCVGLKDVTG